MKRAKPSFLLIALILVALPCGVWGTVTAVYTPESQIVFQIAPGPFTHNTVLGAKLGTFVITSTTGVIYNPALIHIAEASDAIPVTGLMKDSISQYDPFYMTSCNFYIICVSYPNGLGAEPVLRVLYNDVIPIIDNTYTVYQTTFQVELYLVNGNTFSNRHSASGWRPATLFKLNTPYSLPANFNPIFSVSVASTSDYNVGWYTDGNTVNTDLGEYVVTNGQQGPDSTPIIGPGAYTDPNNPGSPGFTFGDPPTQPTNPTYEVFFETSQTDFTLSDAYTGKVRINTANIKVLDGVQGQTYARDIIFTDSGTTNSFQLKPYPSGSPINFKLYFETDTKEVNYGERIPWNGLVPFPLINERGLWIGGISKNEVDQRLSGSYSDTIYVNIISPL